MTIPSSAPYPDLVERISFNSDGSLDEVVAQGIFHLEQMSDNHWWMAVYLPDGRAIHVNLFTPRATVKADWRIESDSGAAVSPPVPFKDIYLYPAPTQLESAPLSKENR